MIKLLHTIRDFDLNEDYIFCFYDENENYFIYVDLLYYDTFTDVLHKQRGFL